MSVAVESPLKPNERFAQLPSASEVEKTAQALRERNHEVVVVGTKEEAVQEVLKRIPQGSEVFTTTSETLRETGVMEALAQGGHYVLLRDKVAALDRERDGREIKRLLASPSFAVGSVHAISQSGDIFVASATGSQLGIYAFGADKMIWVVGAQKIVPTEEDALLRLSEYSLPREDARARKAYGMPSSLNQVLQIRKSAFPGRTTVILVRQRHGF